MYRDILQTARSFYRLSYTLPSVWLAYRRGYLPPSGALYGAMAKELDFNGNELATRLRDNLEIGFVIACEVLKSYLDMRRSGKVDVVAVRYEDLVANPTESIRRILEHCRLPVELVEAARRGLDFDSQRNSPLAKSIIGNLPVPELTSESIVRANAMLKKAGLPLSGEECLIEGTITFGN